MLGLINVRQVEPDLCSKKWFPNANRTNHGQLNKTLLICFSQMNLAAMKSIPFHTFYLR